MYQDFHERIEDWIDMTHAVHARCDKLDDVPEFLLQLPENDDHALDRIAILGEN